MGDSSYTTKYMARWRKLHPDKVNEINRKWRLANPDKCAECSRKWRVSNIEKCRAYTKKWKAEHPDKVLQMKYRNYDQTRFGKNRGNRWQSWEMELIMNKTMSDRELATILGRGVQAIQIKRSRLNDREELHS